MRGELLRAGDAIAVREAGPRASRPMPPCACIERMRRSSSRE
jgi:hypothetical protein